MPRKKTITDIAAYNREYGRVWRALKRKHGRTSTPYPIPINRNNYTTGDLDGERPVCAEFGCGKSLTLTESLYGDKCVSCLGKDNTPINEHMSLPIQGIDLRFQSENINSLYD